jgi:hypothetical protein
MRFRKEYVLLLVCRHAIWLLSSNKLKVVISKSIRTYQHDTTSTGTGVLFKNNTLCGSALGPLLLRPHEVTEAANDLGRDHLVCRRNLLEQIVVLASDVAHTRVKTIQCISTGSDKCLRPFEKKEL